MLQLELVDQGQHLVAPKALQLSLCTLAVVIVDFQDAFYPLYRYPIGVFSPLGLCENDEIEQFIFAAVECPDEGQVGIADGPGIEVDRVEMHRLPL